MSVYINKFYYDLINEEKLIKIMESMVVKSTPFVICLRKLDLENFKQIDSIIENIEDILKVDEFVWVNIINLNIYYKNIKNLFNFNLI
jgi:hypothetical protein